jgi:hypothetical protein
MATKRTPKADEAPYPPDPDPGPGATPEPAPPPPLPEPGALRPPADGHSALAPLPIGPGHFHAVVTDGDVDKLRVIAVAAHDVAQAGGLSTTDLRVARLHGALMAALYGD